MDNARGRTDERSSKGSIGRRTTVNIDLARAALAAQPFSVLLGTRLVEYGPSGVTMELDVRPELLQQHGYVHGGVLSYLVDNAITFAAGAVLGPEIVTSSITVEYLRPALADLSVHAWVEHTGRTRAVARCDVTTRTTDQVVCAIGHGSAMARRSGTPL
ncbi:MAG: PaaI family thioesterase [Jatrophihabitans sp.]|uniref:PaaI family thioesterase n=1 Tax=Jatrophihabitans sp. TaxID=1932789 RepID=UPI0039148761